MASADSSKKESDTPRRRAETPEHRSGVDPSISVPVAAEGSAALCAYPDLERASKLEEQAQRLTAQLEEMQNSILSARVFVSASSAIEDLLVESRRLLESGRHLSDGPSRRALAITYTKIKSQVNEIVEEAEVNDRNLAAGDYLAIAFQHSEMRFLEKDAHALSLRALGLSEQDCSFDSDAEIIEAIVQIETAVNAVRTRRTITEMALSVLNSRVKFARDKIDSLRGASQSWTTQDKTYNTIRMVAAQRLASKLGAPGEQVPSPQAKPATQDNAAPDHASRKAGNSEGSAAQSQPNIPASLHLRLKNLVKDSDETNEGDGLDGLAKELVRLLFPETYLNQWFRYEGGETGIFVRFLAESYGPDLTATVARKFSDEPEFKDAAESYMAEFDSQLRGAVGEKSNSKAKIDELLKTPQGTVYAVLARGCGRV